MCMLIQTRRNIYPIDNLVTCIGQKEKYTVSVDEQNWRIVQKWLKYKVMGYSLCVIYGLYGTT